MVGAYLAKRAEAHGLIIRPIGDLIACSPPLIIAAAEIEELVAILGKALDETWDWVSGEGLASVA